MLDHAICKTQGISTHWEEGPRRIDVIEFEWESINGMILGKDRKIEHELWFKYEL